MNQYMTHPDNLFPRLLRMMIAEIAGQHISGFTDNLYILHNGKITHAVGYELLITDVFRKLHGVLAIVKNIL